MPNDLPTKSANRGQHYGAAPGVGVIDFLSLPEGTRETVIPIRSADGVASRGALYMRGGEKTVVCFSHPRGDMSRHYAAPALLSAGFAAYGHQCRGLNNDVDCEHEKVLFDLAAAFRHLLDNYGFERMVLLGNSGGGSLLSFYQEQSSLSPPKRLTDTSAGEACDLNALDMPKADGVILIGVHPGEGAFMMNCIDPSVIDEADPLSIDPSLDMYNPANGYRSPPEPSHYSREFMARYREAQRARVARLDARAREWIGEQARFRGLMRDSNFERLALEERSYIARRANVGRYMIIYRTEANPAFCDLSLHSWSSTRKVGSIIGPNPEILNYGPGGFARYLTPRAWLSSWSGLSTRASIAGCLRAVREPLLIVSYTSDGGCFPDDNKEQLDACASSDKTMCCVPADHYGLPLTEREKALKLIADWLKARFPASRARAQVS